MEQNNRNSNSPSRFSGEERARITEENAKARAALKREADNYRNAAYRINGNAKSEIQKPEVKTKRENKSKYTASQNSEVLNTQEKVTTRKKQIDVSERQKNVEKSDIATYKNKKETQIKKEKIKSKNSGKNDKGSRNERVRSSTEKRKKDTKIKNALIVTLLFTGAACMIALLCVVILKINTIEVVNTDRYTETQVIEAAGIKKGSSMLFLNVEKINKKIEKALPYTQNVKTERKWPDKITIKTETAVATFAVDTGKGYILLSDSCKVLETSAEFLVSTAAPLKGVSIEKCNPGEQIKLGGNVSTEDLISLITALRDSDIGNITSLDLSEESCVVLVIDHRIEVELGSLSQADEKLLKFAGKVIEETEKTDSAHEIIIDLTGDKEARVRLKESNEVNFEKEPTGVPEQFG